MFWGWGLSHITKPFLAHQLGVQQCNLIDTAYQRWSQIPQESPTRLLPPNPQTPIANPGYSTCASDHLAIDQRFPELSLGLINLLKWLTELRHILVTRSQLYYEWISLGTARWARWRTWYGERTRRLHALSRCAVLSFFPFFSESFSTEEAGVNG